MMPRQFQWIVEQEMPQPPRPRLHDLASTTGPWPRTPGARGEGTSRNDNPGNGPACNNIPRSRHGSTCQGTRKNKMNQNPSSHDERRANTQPHPSAQPDAPRHRIVQSIALVVIALVVAAGAAMAIWHYPFVSEGSAQSPASQKKSRASAPDKSSSPFVRHAEEGGITVCKDTYTALGEALVAGASYMVQTETASNDPDRHFMQGLVGLTYPSQGDYSGPAAGLVFAGPTTTGGICEGSLVRVVPFQQSCQAAANLLPKGSRQGQQLAGVYTFALPNGGHAMLLPSGQNCVVLSVVRGAG